MQIEIWALRIVVALRGAAVSPRVGQALADSYPLPDEDRDGLTWRELVGMAGRPPCAPVAIGVAAQLAPMVRVWHQ
jgi:hypothetical protein